MGTSVAGQIRIDLLGVLGPEVVLRAAVASWTDSY
jgi:hypothetical protein